MKIYTEDQLQVDENGNVQTDGSEKDGQAAGEDDKDQKTYEAIATVEDSEDQICDFGTVKSDLEDVEAGDQSGTFYGSGYYRTAECR